MLVLSRAAGEKIIIDGGITVTVVEVKRGRVSLGVEAPANVTIQRPEADKPPREKP
jgi:carbon storage regulator